MTPVQKWEPQRTLDADGARTLLHARLPEVRADTVVLLGAGWDNTCFLVDDKYVFRFPRRPFGAEVVALERRVLNALAATLPVRIPEPRYLAPPAGDDPWPFAGYSLVPGETACRVPFDESARAALAAPLGHFLGVLHGLDFDAGLPGDVIGRMDLAKRTARIPDQLAELTRVGLIDNEDEYRPLAKGLMPFDGPGVLCHGDLYARHIILDENAALSGVIDWGDVHRGDPAVDLMIAYVLLPATARDRLFDAYGSVDDNTRRRARFRALSHTATVGPYAAETQDEPLLEACRFALRHLSR